MTSDRTYQRTHPWISFSVDLGRASRQLWMMLGQCQGMCEHVAEAPLRPVTADTLHRVYLAKGVLGTAAIEGNTLTEEQVLQHLEGTLQLPPSQQYLEQEIENIVRACNQIFERIVRADNARLSTTRFKEFNRDVLVDLTLAENVVPGETRRHSVVVARYRGAPPEDCEHLLDRLADWLERMDEELSPLRDWPVARGLLKAVLAHLYLAWIHPFGDGNGRTARLAEFQLLLQARVPTPAAHLLSNHYNQTRNEYYRQLDVASKSGGDVLPFIEYAVSGFLDGLREQLELIHRQQLDVAWRDFVHESFREKTGNANRRRRHLILDLSLSNRTVPVNELTELSPRLARAYAGKTSRTLSRDVGVLREMELVDTTPDGVRARAERILAYLPISPDYS